MLFVYSRNVAQKLVLISQEIDDMRAAVASFASHVKTVYEMEMFYGDEILGGLIAHSRALRDTLEDFADIYALIDEDYDEVEEDETEEVPDDAEAEA